MEPINYDIDLARGQQKSKMKKIVYGESFFSEGFSTFHVCSGFEKSKFNEEVSG